MRGRLSTQTRLALALRAGHEMRECERVAADVEETKLRRYESAFRDTGGGGGGGGGSTACEVSIVEGPKPSL